MSQIERIKQAIMADPQNASYTERGIEPLFAAPKTARINIVGQAPGLKTQEAGLYWKDKSGDRLRDWLGVDEDTFYNSGCFAVLPMDFYFPGHGKSGDLPPRAGFAEKWHPQLLQELSVNPFDWAICSSLLFTGKNQWQGDRTGKTLPELLTSLFSISSPFTSKSNLDGQKSLV